MWKLPLWEQLRQRLGGDLGADENQRLDLALARSQFVSYKLNLSSPRFP